MISFSQPVYFTALSSIVLIVVIHLLNKRNPKPILFASIKLFQHSESQKVKKLHFNEFWLFILRSLIVSMLVLILAGPILDSFISIEREKWILIDPNIDENLIQSDIDSLTQIGFSKHYFQTGFPKEKVIFKDENYWSLLSEAQHFASTIHVYSRSLLKNFRLKRPTVSAEIKWIHVANRSEEVNTVMNNHIEGRNLKFNLLSSETSSHFEKKTVKENQAVLPDVNVHIYYSSNFKTDLKFIKAAIFAINQIELQQIRIKEYQIEKSGNLLDADWVIWLSDQTFQSNTQLKAKFLIFKPNDSEKLINQENASFYSLNRRLPASLNPTVFSDELPKSLAHLIVSIPYEKIKTYDQRILNYKQMNLSDITRSGSKSETTESAATYFWFIFLALLITERFYSVRRVK